MPGVSAGVPYIAAGVPACVPGVYCGGDPAGKCAVLGVSTRAVGGTCAGVGGVTCHAESRCGVLQGKAAKPQLHREEISWVENAHATLTGSVDHVLQLLS